MRTNYIIANYIGPNRQYPLYKSLFETDPLFFYKKHLDFFTRNNLPDISCTFVFNDDVDSLLKDKINDLNRDKHEVIFRSNAGFSYGIWNDTVIKNLDQYDAFFLIEDDYLPSTDKFLTGFKQKITSKVAFVCSLVELATHERFSHSVPATQAPFRFPSISNGLLLASACRVVMSKYGTLFRINDRSDYWSAYTNQIYFLKNFNDIGYDVVDTTDEYCSPYYNSHENRILNYGKGETLIEPILITN